jgi:hypothetical protein
MKDSTLSSAQFSGLYFGVSGAVSSLAQIAGLSTITVNVLALVVGFFVSEILKYYEARRQGTHYVPGTYVFSSFSPTILLSFNAILLLYYCLFILFSFAMYQLMQFDQPNMGEIMKFQRKVGV